MKRRKCEEQSVVILCFWMLRVLLWQVQWNDSQTGTPWKGHKTENNPLRACGRCKICALSTAIILLLCLGEVKLCWAVCWMKKNSTKAVTQLTTTTETTQGNKGVSLEMEMCVELLQKDHEEWRWWIELNKRNREGVKENNWNEGGTARRLK